MELEDALPLFNCKRKLTHIKMAVRSESTYCRPSLECWDGGFDSAWGADNLSCVQLADTPSKKYIQKSMVAQESV
jgi:hypothetical protein